MLALPAGAVLKKRDMLRPKLTKPRGILHLSADHPMTGYARYWPDDDLTPFVEHLWTVEWDLAQPTVSEVLSHPSVQLVIERSSSRVAGVHTGLFRRRLEGQGRVLGVKFRPGGFRPFYGRRVAELANRMLPLGDVFGPAASELEPRALAHRDHEAAFAPIQEFLRARLPAPDPTLELVGRIAARTAEERGITRVEHLVREFGLSTRKLQRLFDDYVGASPKWVIQRYRLHEAAERIAAGTAIDWADFAAELGYADQAHFIRDFRKLTGRSPAEYGRRLQRRH